MKTFPYNRIVQWAAGPVAGAVGLLVAWLATKIGIVAAHKDAWQHDITVGVMFAVSALVTYAAHHKWLDNLNKWWRDHHLPVQPFSAQPSSGGAPGMTVVNTGATSSSEPSDAAGVSEVPPTAPGS